MIEAANRAQSVKTSGSGMDRDRHVRSTTGCRALKRETDLGGYPDRQFLESRRANRSLHGRHAGTAVFGPSAAALAGGIPAAPAISPPTVFPVANYPTAFPGAIGLDSPAVVTAPALLTIVALRRGQPQGPSNDHEVEDFIYDAFELLPGTTDVEVRCEGGRLTLTGSVQHKRVKRDVGEIAWAIRKDSPELKAAVNKFLETNGRDSLTARMIFRRYLLNTQYVKGAAAEQSRKRFAALVALFRKYGQKYSMDWMLMAAQGYQESRLDHSARSHVGAIGVMQVMPATGKELKVGDITVLEPNIHAGVKYMRGMVDRYFANEPMDDINKLLFAFAAYNAGPGRVRQLRREATAEGLDPNVWFNNVERIASARIGRETVTYVSNIYKYYVTYLLIQGEYLQRRDLKKKGS